MPYQPDSSSNPSSTTSSTPSSPAPPLPPSATPPSPLHPSPQCPRQQKQFNLPGTVLGSPWAPRLHICPMKGARALGCPQGKDLLHLLACLDLHWDGEKLEAEMSSKDEFRTIQVGRELGSL